jgi:hypothetical protein
VGEGGFVGNADELGPGDEVEGRQHTLEPGMVLGHLLARQVAQTRSLGLAYPVFDAGVGALEYFEPGDRKSRGLACRSFGADEGGVAKSFDLVEEAELGPGMWALCGRSPGIPRATPRDRARR